MKTAAACEATWAWCDCDAADWYEAGTHPEIGVSGDVACACGRPGCAASLWKRSDLVHWGGKHWLVAHAFEEALCRLSAAPAAGGGGDGRR